jgi:hypothetical protein
MWAPMHWHTLHPLDFIRIKAALANNPQRDPIKRPKDLLQAQTVERLWNEWLQHLVGNDA